MSLDICFGEQWPTEWLSFYTISFCLNIFVYDVNLFVHIVYGQKKKKTHIANLSSHLQCQVRHIVESNCTGWVKY